MRFLSGFRHFYYSLTLLWGFYCVSKWVIFLRICTYLQRSAKILQICTDSQRSKTWELSPGEYIGVGCSDWIGPTPDNSLYVIGAPGCTRSTIPSLRASNPDYEIGLQTATLQQAKTQLDNGKNLAQITSSSHHILQFVYSAFSSSSK